MATPEDPWSTYGAGGIGVNTAIATVEGSGNIGIGFAVPIDRAITVAERLIAGA